MNKLLFLAFVAANIFIVVGGIFAAENLQKAESVCPSGTILKGRVAIALPECQKILRRSRQEKQVKYLR